MWRYGDGVGSCLGQRFGPSQQLLQTAEDFTVSPSDAQGDSEATWSVSVAQVVTASQLVVPGALRHFLPLPSQSRNRPRQPGNEQHKTTI